MAIKIVPFSFGFAGPPGRIQTQTVDFNFNGEGGTVKLAVAVLAGFEVHFNNGEHPILQEQIKLEVPSIRGNVVVVKATFLLRDGSGNIDDPYSGSIDAVILADIN